MTRARMKTRNPARASARPGPRHTTCTRPDATPPHTATRFRDRIADAPAVTPNLPHAPPNTQWRLAVSRVCAPRRQRRWRQHLRAVLLSDTIERERLQAGIQAKGHAHEQWAVQYVVTGRRRRATVTHYEQIVITRRPCARVAERLLPSASAATGRAQAGRMWNVGCINRERAGQAGMMRSSP